MKKEAKWYGSLVRFLQKALQTFRDEGVMVRVESGHRLAYTHEVMAYDQAGVAETHSQGYQTDVLVSDVYDDGRWAPRVVVECKVGGVTTHDALTYSAKADTHKHVHPYLRYGILIGEHKGALPTRLVRHGAYFDFMMVWNSLRGGETERKSFVGVVGEEIKASRQVQRLLTDRSRGKRTYCLLHRPLRLT